MRFIHGIACSCNLFIVIVVYITLRIYHSFIDRHLGSFYFLIIMNKVALNILVHVFSSFVIQGSVEVKTKSGWVKIFHKLYYDSFVDFSMHICSTHEV